MEFYQGYSGGQAAVIGSVLVQPAEVCFYVIPEEVIDSLIEEEITLNVAGGLMPQHPLIFPFVEAMLLMNLRFPKNS
ncbi:hypothetical protein DVH24_032564 [Malus domestica]|uniref:Uncharacterized protein n=1 Tax=Malus domestica TaxID=3750 RepID=A0A498J6B1_MALDO|nr:hypothetical protein DVH24_032564 [Malus domestica]